MNSEKKRLFQLMNIPERKILNESTNESILNAIRILKNSGIQSDNVIKAITLLNDEINSGGSNGDMNHKDDSQSLYFAGKSNGKLINQQNNPSGALFRVFNISNNSGSVEYIGPAKNENWFDIAIIDNSVNDNVVSMRSIKTTQPGTVKKENGDWVFSKPMHVLFSM